MKLRPVTSSDIPLLQYWDSQPHVIEASGDDMPWDWGQELATDPDWRDLVIAEVAEKPIGVMQIIVPAEEETHYWGDVAAGLRAIDIWIGEEAYIGRGFGAQMMGLALQMCFGEYGADAVLIDPLVGNTRALRFYERSGYDELSGGASALTIVLSIGWTAKTGPPDNERRRGLLTGPARNPFLTGTGGSSATFGRSCRRWSKEASAQLSYERIHARDTRFNA